MKGNEPAFQEDNQCTFPDCGCPEARLCMVGNPNEASLNLNRPKRSALKNRRTSKYIVPAMLKESEK